MYNAIIARIYTRPHPNADKLQLGNCSGFQIVTGLDTKNEQLGCFFPSDGQLSKEFCYENSEYRTGKGENKNPNKSGYFEENRRIKSISLRGQKSEGYWVPLSSLAWTGVDLSTLKEGDQFCTLNGKLVCEKYYSPATKRMMDSKTNKQGKKKLKDIPMFKKHFDTQQLRYNFHRIPHDAHVVITEKLHGCVDYSTLVDTLEYGTIKIGKLVDEKLPVHIKSLNLETKEIEYAPVSNHYLLKNDGEWYEIELEDGRTIIITGNNPVYLPNLNCYRRADELTVDDFVLVD
jgi:hypothetical protein